MKPHMVVCVIALIVAAAHAAEVPVMVPAPSQVPKPAITNIVQPAVSTNTPGLPTLNIWTLPSNTVFTVQLGAFTTRERAFVVFWELSPKVPSLQLIPPFGKDKLYRVSHGSFPSYEAARVAAEKLTQENIECFVTPVGMPELVTNQIKGD